MLSRALRTSVSCRLPFRATIAHVKFEEIEDDLKEYMHGRKFSERRDSVSREILLERKSHQEKFATVNTDSSLIKNLVQLKLGVKKRLEGVYEKIVGESGDLECDTGAGGHGVHIASAAVEWPLFKHLLPEIVFAGHSNSGKSTLVNGLSGMLPRKGPASTSERAGWTDQICFYQLGKKPPVMTLVDFPGYGHAIATVDHRKEWIRMTRSYLANRSIITRCCILVDCTRGLCHGDRSLMRYLNRINIPWLIIMTKGDLLSPEDLAASITLVRQEVVRRGLVSVKPVQLRDEEWEALMAAEKEQEGGEKEDEQQQQREMKKVEKISNKAAPSVTSSSPVAGTPTEDGVVDVTSDLELNPTGLTYDDEDSYLESLPPVPIVGKRALRLAKRNAEAVEKKAAPVVVKDDVSVSVAGEALEDRDGVTILPVSANSGAGVQALWKKLCAMAEEDSKMAGMYAVREHKRADHERKKIRIARMLATAKAHNITMVKKKSPVIRK